MTQGNYTTASWNHLQAMLSAANAVNDNRRATQAQVNTAYANLRAALNALEANQPPPPPDPPPRPDLPIVTIPPSNQTPADTMEAIRTGNIGALMEPVYSIFVAHATSPMLIIISLTAIILGVKIVPRVFSIIFTGKGRGL